LSDNSVHTLLEYQPLQATFIYAEVKAALPTTQSYKTYYALIVGIDLAF